MSGYRGGGGGGGGSASGSPIYVSPIDGVSDDWASLQTTLNASIALGQQVIMVPGPNNLTFQALSASLILKAGARLYGTPATKINVNLGTSATSSAFVSGVISTGSVGTLLVNIAQYATTFTSPIALPAGTVFQLACNTPSGAIYTSQGQTGTGPWVVTLDRPVYTNLFTTANATTVQIVSSYPSDIVLDGQGMQIVGGSLLNVGQFFGLTKSVVRNIEIVGSGMTWGASGCGYIFDSSCRAVLAEHLNFAGVTLNGSSPNAIDVAGVEGMVLRECNMAVNGAAQVVLVQISDGVDVVDCQAYSDGASASNTGLAFNLSTNCRASGGLYTGMSANGVNIQNSCVNTVLDDVNSSANGTANILLVNGSSNVNTRILNCRTDGATNGGGLNVNTGNTGTEIVNHTANNNASYGVAIQSDCVVSGVVAAGNTNENIWVVTANNQQVSIDGASTTGVNMLVSAASGSTVRLTNSSHNCNTASETVITCSAGELQVSGVSVKGANVATSTGILVNGGNLRLGPNNDFDSCATKVSVTSGVSSRGTVVANGTTPVAVAWANIRSTDRVVLSGGQGTAYVTSITAGTGFSIVATVADTTTYNYMII